MKRHTIDTIVISLGGIVVFVLFWISGFDHRGAPHHAHVEAGGTLTKTVSSGVGAEVTTSPVAPTACISGQGAVIHVELSDTAYTPKDIRATRCDILEVKNTGKKSHQPASGPHPTHDSYVEINAPTPLKTGQTFTAQLVKTGSYTVHDHMNDDIEATLTVSE